MRDGAGAFFLFTVDDLCCFDKLSTLACEYAIGRDCSPPFGTGGGGRVGGGSVTDRFNLA
jgi:hypothetical protein